MLHVHRRFVLIEDAMFYKASRVIDYTHTKGLNTLLFVLYKMCLQGGAVRIKG